MRPIKKGSTDQSCVIRIIDSTNGTPETGVVYNTAGIDLWYRREGATKTSITEATLSALSDAHSDGGILHIGDGYYRLDLPDAAVDTGANGVMVGGTVTGMIVIGTYIPLVSYDPYDGVRAGLTALPNASADAAGGLPISDAGGLDLDTKLANTNEITAARLSELDAGTAGKMANQVDEIRTDTEDIQTTVADIPTNAELSAAVANVSVDEIQATAIADLFNTNSGTTYASAVAGSAVKEIADNAVGSSLTVADIADGVWDEALSGHTTEGTAGKALADASSADDPWSTSLPGAYGAGTAGKIIGDNINAPIATVDTVVDAIKAKTDSLTFTVAGDVDVNVQTWKGSAAQDMTGDAFSRIGAPTGASVSADIATLSGYLDTEISTIIEDTGTTIPALIAALNDPSAAAIADAVLDEVLSDLSDNSLNAGQDITPRKAIRALFNRFFRKITQTAATQTMYNDSGTQVAAMAVSDDGTTQTKDIAT